MYTNSTDSELVSFVKEDIELAYNEIYLRYWKSVFLTAINRLNNRSVAEELVQDIFCNFWNRRHSFELKTTLNAYFSVSIKYEIINYLVKRKRENEYFEYQKHKNKVEDLSTIHNIQLNDLLEHLEKTIALLPERCQLVFRLRFEQDLSHKKIGEELGIAEKTVQAHLTKARKHIQSQLGVTSFLLINLFLY